MDEPVWLQRAWVDFLHAQQLKRFGGLMGTRDEGALDSALQRARYRWAHAGEEDVCILAAAYGFGLARSLGYSDGNKRVAFVAMVLFLELNGLILDAPEPEVVMVMNEVAAGARDEQALAAWLRDFVSPTGL